MSRDADGRRAPDETRTSEVCPPFDVNAGAAAPALPAAAPAGTCPGCTHLALRVLAVEEDLSVLRQKLRDRDDEVAGLRLVMARHRGAT